MTVEFKPVEIQDKKIFDNFFKADPPEISEFTFTNLFMWEHRYHPRWAQLEDILLIILYPDNSSPFCLPPAGIGDKSGAIDVLLRELEKITSEPRLCRASESFVNKYVDSGRYECVEDSANSDYVYSVLDLIELSGRKYHRKKNHLNRFIKNFQFEYFALDLELVECFIDMQEEWCQMKECVESPDLLAEDYAIHKALTNFEDLSFIGGAIKVNGRIEAISLGEILNPDTAVIHIEKANPEIPGLYTAINQLFCQNAWAEIDYINREQDLGIEGLRKAKESYHPHHMVKKYTISKKSL
jgi:hypothetical protein